MSSEDPDFDQRAPVLAALAFRVCFRILGDRHEAEDLSQEALARAYARWSRVARYDEAWVSRVATNLALGVARKQSRPDRRSRAVPAAPLDAVVAQRAELVELLNHLPRRQREVVALRYLADRPEAEVAAVLGCSVGTVKAHASRGLAALRAALSSPEPIAPEGVL